MFLKIDAGNIGSSGAAQAAGFTFLNYRDEDIWGSEVNGPEDEKITKFLQLVMEEEGAYSHEYAKEIINNEFQKYGELVIEEEKKIAPGFQRGDLKVFEFDAEGVKLMEGLRKILRHGVVVVPGEAEIADGKVGYAWLQRLTGEVAEYNRDDRMGTSCPHVDGRKVWVYKTRLLKMQVGPDWFDFDFGDDTTTGCRLQKAAGKPEKMFLFDSSVLEKITLRHLSGEFDGYRWRAYDEVLRSLLKFFSENPNHPG